MSAKYFYFCYKHQTAFLNQQQLSGKVIIIKNVAIFHCRQNAVAKILYAFKSKIKINRKILQLFIKEPWIRIRTKKKKLFSGNCHCSFYSFYFVHLEEHPLKFINVAFLVYFGKASQGCLVSLSAFVL